MSPLCAAAAGISYSLIAGPRGARQGGLDARRSERELGGGGGDAESRLLAADARRPAAEVLSDAVQVDVGGCSTNTPAAFVVHTSHLRD